MCALSLTREEVRRVDRWAIDEVGVPGAVLMENAGRGVAESVLERYGGAADRTARRVGVLCGPGNNGGDGFVVARHLALHGWPVVTFLTVPEEKVAGDARRNLDALRALGADVRRVEEGDADRLADRLAEFDLLVDALGGTGVVGALRGAMKAAVEQVNAAGKPVVAIDIPTGLDCDEGTASGPAIRAQMTVTFVARKRGFDNPESLRFTGDVVVAHIGVPATASSGR